MSAHFLIWSHQHGAWWRANQNGYTSDIDQAGRYPMQEAYNICASANRGMKRRYPPNELAINESDALWSCDTMTAAPAVQSGEK